MNNPILKYCLVFLLALAAIVALQTNKPKKIDWTETLSNDDKIPFGSYIFFNELKKINGEENIIIKDKSPYEYLDWAEDEAGGLSNLIILQSAGSIDEFEWEKITDYVQRGNCAFISTQDFDNNAYDNPLPIEIEYKLDWQTKDSIITYNFVNPQLASNQNYSLPYINYCPYLKIDYLDEEYIKWTNTRGNKLKITGVLYDSLANFVEITMGSGKIYIHLLPKAFSNFSLVRGNNWEYAFKAISYLPKRPILWDEFYKIQLNGEKIKTGSPLSYILKQTPFRWAFYLLVSGIFLFIIFRAKRIQKLIPVIKPLANSSLEFTKTIGRLYYNRGDHKDIANKKIQFFFQFVSSRYYIHYSNNNALFCKLLADKSGIAEGTIIKLLDKIHELRNKKHVDAKAVIELNKKIDEFYQHVNKI